MIKVLVKLPDGFRRCITISTGCESDGIAITWSTVLNELVKQFPIITPDKHVFEVFDEDFNKFYLISSNSHMIDDLSLIRVRDKRIGNQLSDQSVVTIDDDNRIAKTRISQIDNNLNNSGDTYTGNSNGLELDIQGMGADLTLTTSITGNTNSVETPVDPFEMSTQLSSGINTTITSTPVGDSQQNPIDYLGLSVHNTGYYADICSRYLYYKTFSIPMGSLWIRCISFIATDVIAINKMLYLLDKYRPINGKLMDDQCWAQMATEMPRSRHYHTKDVIFNCKKCRSYFINALDLYKKTLTSCPDMEIAGLVNPLFYTLHVFDPKYILSADECQEIQRLRQQFTDKCANNPNAISIITDKTVNRVKPVPKMLNKPNIMINSIAKPALAFNGCFEASFDHNLHDLRVNSPNVTEQDLQTYQYLCYYINWTQNQYNNYNQIWPNVSRLMIESGYGTFDVNTCQIWFNDYVLKYYKVALINYSRHSDAVKVYPFFATIHAMDLSQSLSLVAYDKSSPSKTTLTPVTQVIEKVPGHLKQPKKLFKKWAKLTVQDLQRFQTLCQCIDLTVEKLGPFRGHKRKFWPHVAKCMANTGLTDCGQLRCRNLFSDHVNYHYKNALTHLGQYSKAVKVYPFFQVIHDMDLSQSLSLKAFKKIKQIKDTFKML